MEEKKRRRRYEREFKEGAVRLVIEGGQTLAGTAKDLGITENMLGRWKKEYLGDREQAFPVKGSLPLLTCSRHRAISRKEHADKETRVRQVH